MSSTAAEGFRPFPTPQALAGAAGVLAGGAAFVLALRLAPAGFWIAPALFAVVVASAAVVYAGAASARESGRMAMALLAAAALLSLAAASGLDGERLEPPFAFVALGLAGASALGCGQADRRGWIVADRADAALFAAVALALLAYNAWYVLASQDLEIADFMYFRLVSIAVASLIDSGRLPQLAFEIAASLKADYSWIAGVAPGVVLAAGAPLSRAAYQTAIMAFYAAPALLALGWLARALAARAGATLNARTALVFAVAAVAAAYPTGLAVAARGMPDIGGLALYVYALRTADKYLRAAAASRAGALLDRLAAALVLTVFAMFVFRRWYAFAALGVVGAMAAEGLFVVLDRRNPLDWAAVLKSGALAILLGAALFSPILVAWCVEPGRHDYGSLYAAYRKPTQEFLSLVGEWWGSAVLALAGLAFAWLLRRSADARLARLTLASGALAAALFLRIQTPYVHHLYLVAPWACAIGAGVVGIASRSRASGLLALAGLAAFTLTPLGALAPKGLFPIYGRPHPPRTDLAELQRMKAWVDAHATPDRKVCGLGSSYTFSGQLLDELWQLDAVRSPIRAKGEARTSVAMPDVDNVDGPPPPELADCAYAIVGDPVQTHLDRAYQQTVILPSEELLTGSGVGTHYARTGEMFRLENGVLAVVFKRTKPLSNEDILALVERWRAARAKASHP